MKVSYHWLQSYFDEKLPEPEKLGELLTFASFELEGIEKESDDVILDLKVLPDRACYALSHRGIGYEVSAIIGFPKKKEEQILPPIQKVRLLSVRVETPDLCPRYMARVIENVSQKESPLIKERLQSLGQRSINPIVDIANFVMFDRGQPLHAFDADKVRGGIVVRMARAGEKITTLDNREVNLDESILIIADEEAPLAIAGIKGGKRAEVTSATKNLILESASFDSAYIRKNSDKLGIRTDASKRYENKFSADMASKGVDDFSSLLFEMDSQILAGEVVDIYSNVLKNTRITVTMQDISNRLGLKLSLDVIINILKSLKIGIEKNGDELVLTIPPFRRDLSIPEDIAEEVARLVGYDTVPAMLPPKYEKELEIPKQFYYEWKIRDFLVGACFSEVMTSSFSSKGEKEILKPLADNKKFVRQNLLDNFVVALKLNSTNAPLFSGSEIRIFEIGRVFLNSGEQTALCIGIAKTSGNKGESVNEKIRAIRDNLVQHLGVPITSVCTVDDSGGIILLSGKSIGTINTVDGTLEMNLNDLIDSLPQPRMWDITLPEIQNVKYRPFSSYPFIVRDVALFVPSGTDSEIVHQLILKEAGSFVVHSKLFDRFEKNGKISYAFRLVFQSMDKTLTDEEVNKIMENVYMSLKAEGREIR